MQTLIVGRDSANGKAEIVGAREPGVVRVLVSRTKNKPGFVGKLVDDLSQGPGERIQWTVCTLDVGTSNEYTLRESGVYIAQGHRDFSWQRPQYFEVDEHGTITLSTPVKAENRWIAIVDERKKAQEAQEAEQNEEWDQSVFPVADHEKPRKPGR